MKPRLMPILQRDGGHRSSLLLSLQLLCAERVVIGGLVVSMYLPIFQLGSVLN